MKRNSASGDEEAMSPMFPFGQMDEYFNQPVLFKDCDTHYELIYTGEFESVGRESIEITKLMQDLKDGDKDKELHIFISSIGGSVENLSLLLQQVLQYQHRITICCGSALSAGFILWACGNERYVSPYSELMYHTIYSGYEGKGVELSSYGNHVERLTDSLMDAVGMKDIIPDEDLARGKSTEVWYLGEDFIKSGKAKSYDDYVSRVPPVPVPVALAGGRFFAKYQDKYVELKIDMDRQYDYTELVNLEQPSEEEAKTVAVDSDAEKKKMKSVKATSRKHKRRSEK